MSYQTNRAIFFVVDRQNDKSLKIHIHKMEELGFESWLWHPTLAISVFLPIELGFVDQNVQLYYRTNLFPNYFSLNTMCVYRLIHQWELSLRKIARLQRYIDQRSNTNYEKCPRLICLE
jgi:hypothetical protein